MTDGMNQPGLAGGRPRWPGLLLLSGAAGISRALCTVQCATALLRCWRAGAAARAAAAVHVEECVWQVEAVLACENSAGGVQVGVNRGIYSWAKSVAHER